MILISKILFFASHHGFYTAIILALFFGLLFALTKKWWTVLPALPLAILNGIGGQFFNAWFLNKYGIEGTAIITSDIETSSTLNDRYIHDYEAIVRKQDGSYVSTVFSTTTAAIYPIENAIRIPRSGEPFPVKYIPGYEKNMVILYYQSEEGKALRKYELQAPVNAAKIKYEADPSNPEFVEEYISALQDYLKVYDDQEYRIRLQELQNMRK